MHGGQVTQVARSWMDKPGIEGIFPVTGLPKALMGYRCISICTLEIMNRGSMEC